MLYEEVGHQACVTTVPVREWVNPDKSMMETNREFIGFEDFTISPMTSVLDQLPDLGAYLELVHSDVLVCPPYLPCPGPDSAEHPLVRGIEEVLREDVRGPTPEDGTVERPLQTRLDVRLLQFVQLGARGHVRKE
ncbi:MAG: hypothetical protein RJQ04_19890 [Longimicrobiales bacterium]